MKHTKLWRVSVTTSAEAEDAVAEFLGNSFGHPASSYTDAESGQATVSVYLRDRPARFGTIRKELALGLKRIARSGLNARPGRISLTSIPKRDWAESWKLHFKPVVIGSALLLKPSWSRRPALKGQAVVILDPGLSFGTGRHPTTAFCLRQLVALRPRAEVRSCLDLGTGSGILAIAAAKLGYRPIEALDFDPEAVRIARANARRNAVATRIRFQQRDLTRLPRRSVRKYTVICANLVSSLLLLEQERILARLHADGVLVVAGILNSEFGQVETVFGNSGLRLIAARTQNEWRSGAFAWRKAVQDVPPRRI